MTNFPSTINPITTIHSFSDVALRDAFRWMLNATPSNNITWPLSNIALYIPFTLNQSILVQKLFVVNGGTTGNNFDVGIYNVDGTKIVSSGSTVQSGTSQVQYVSVTPFTLGAGAYYLALSVNGTTSNFVMYSGGTSRHHKFMGIYEQTSAFALPATATFATSTRTVTPLIGLSTIP